MSKRGPAFRVAVDKEKAEAESPFSPKSVFEAPLLESDMRFSGRQVRALVEGAVRDRERQLRDEYDGILADRLDEQWRTFATFNEANLHSKLEKSTYDYFC